MTFPLFHRPGTVVFLDDDPDYLEMLALVLPRHWHLRLFMRPTECIAHLLQEPPFWEADAWNQQQLVDLWREGKPLIPQILGYWSKYTERYALSRVCVVDFSMPGMDGLQTLAELGDWPGSRVLLTGQADEQVAVRAFNRGLIHQFIPKQTQDISRRLIEAVERLLFAAHPRHAQTWRATLKPEQASLLRAPGVAAWLSAFCAKNWVEHVAIGDPFGVLGMDAAGKIGWLQLETRDGLQALAEMAEVAGVPAAGVAQVRSGARLADVELRQALSSSQPVTLVPAFSVGEGEGALLGALFPVEPTTGPDPNNSYSRWLARQPKRHVQE
ncbi:MAG: putative response regulator, atypical CheY [Ramlibacter sp.]|jgi:CheY-like chemotaxis protein|uniref:response regulator n=1 Tax=Ramlibacter sp. TaxID=1917967 RepID=UPI002613ED73|nr:response regulator [Ramlibacter sp.]MDB5753539.1 putative response regulator, atypical CheY [Ramlibacter sp.]